MEAVPGGLKTVAPQPTIEDRKKAALELLSSDKVAAFALVCIGQDGGVAQKSFGTATDLLIAHEIVHSVALTALFKKQAP